MNDVIERILVTEEEIIKRSKELGAVITQDYRDAGKTPIVVGLLKGSVPFLAEIMKHIDLDIEIDFMDVSSYDGAQSVGEVKINKDLSQDIENRDVIIVEDILDSGITLSYLTKYLQNRKPSSICIATLLDKPARRRADVQAKYVGFTVPDAFVVGYGLDYAEKYRNLPFIGVLKPEVYEK